MTLGEDSSARWKYWRRARGAGSHVGATRGLCAQRPARRDFPSSVCETRASVTRAAEHRQQLAHAQPSPREARVSPQCFAFYPKVFETKKKKEKN